MYYKPEDTSFYAQKCGSEQLYVSLSSGDPMAFYLEVHLKDLDRLSILLLSQIGFWSGVHRAKTPNSKYLLQIEESSFAELAENSEYPIFSSSYFVSCGETLPRRVNVPIADPECSVRYYLVCLASEKRKYEKLFKRIHVDTVK